MKIKTIHGSSEIELQRYRNNLDYFNIIGQESLVSRKLREIMEYYSNKLSYKEVEKLIEGITGEKIISDQGIWAKVIGKAAEISKESKKEVEEIVKKKEMPEIKGEVKIYEGEAEEILIYSDGILVKEQKEKREKKGEEIENQEKERGKRKWVSTEVIMIENKDKKYNYLTAGINEKGEEIISIEEIVKAKIITEYGNNKEPLPIVAITDGATTIRRSFMAIFGVSITLILDWYHLTKKVSQLMSMIAKNKAEKLMACEVMLQHLWVGNTEAVLLYLATFVPKNQEKHQELLKYLKKHQSEIINYQLRQEVGKSIGSGRMEKGVDTVIGQRQKHKAMSWSRTGSKSLAIVKSYRLNSGADSPF